MATGYLIIVMIIIFVLGLVAGFLIGRGKKVPIVGSFTINHSDPTKDFCSLRLDYDLDLLERYRTFALKLELIDDKGSE